MLGFTQRRTRDAGQITMALLAGLWTGTYTSDPPIVAVTSGKRTLVEKASLVQMTKGNQPNLGISPSS